MTDLIEAIARGIFDASRRAIGGQVTWNDEWPDQTTKDEARACARAALLAIEQSGTHVVVPVIYLEEVAVTTLDIFDALGPVAAAMGRPDLQEEAAAMKARLQDAMLSARPKVPT